MKSNGFCDYKFKELQHFAEIILSSDSRQKAMERFNGLRRGYSKAKVLTTTTKWRLRVLEDILSIYKK
jgi:hypothetical protein